VVVRINLPEELAQRYEIQAHGADLGEYLTRRLSETIDFDATHGVYLKDEHRHELMQLLGRNFNTPKELLEIFRQAVTLKLAETPVPIEQTLLKRCAARATAERVDTATWLAREAIIGLERTCGPHQGRQRYAGRF
jgi:hypothetical protein